jgi:hypothetical protein
MANKKLVAKVVEEVKEIEELEPIAFPRRIHINEFTMAHATHLDEMQKAGLKALARGKEWMDKDEWQAILDKYLG